MKRRQTTTCAICGEQAATTKDHIPPKGIFPRPRPSDLITVPACRLCNKASSGLDEVFKVFVGIAAGHGPEGERMFKDQTSKTLQHNRRLRAQIANTVQDLWLRSPEGVVLGRRSAVPLDSKAHDQTIEKMIRGLHFHHTGAVIADRADIKVHWHDRLSQSLYEMSLSWATGVVGHGQFIYRYLTHPEEPLTSLWILQFFGKAWSSGAVLRRENPGGDQQ